MANCIVSFCLFVNALYEHNIGKTHRSVYIAEVGSYDDCCASDGWLTVTTAVFQMVDLLWRLLCFRWLTYCDDCCVSDGWLTVTTALFPVVDLLWRLLCFRWLSYYDGNRTQTAMEMHIYYSFIANWVRYVLICVSFKANPTESRHCKPAFLTRVDTCSFPACFWHLCTFSMSVYVYTSSCRKV